VIIAPASAELCMTALRGGSGGFSGCSDMFQSVVMVYRRDRQECVCALLKCWDMDNREMLHCRYECFLEKTSFNSSVQQQLVRSAIRD
jgi:hypothetical protein